MSSAWGLVSRVYRTFNPPEAPKDPNALRFGILGAAAIVPMSLIIPAKSHPEIVIDAIAARDLTRAKVFAKKHGIPRTFPSYQELIDDEAIDVVYIPLPNGLHYEWAMKALQAGKHVLIEKPAANTAEEARAIFALAKEKNLIVMEAFHYRFHPVINKVKEIVDSGAIGQVVHIEADLGLPKGSVKPNDIRMDYALGGGAMMDAGTYPVNAARYIIGSEPISVEVREAYTFPSDKRIDLRARSIFSFPPASAASSKPITAEIYTDYEPSPRLGFIPHFTPFANLRVVCEKGSIVVGNYLVPNFYHTMEVRRIGEDGKETKENLKLYTFEEGKGKKGEVWWNTWRWMLESFVDKIQSREPAAWIEPENTIANMVALDMFYEEAGLTKRPKSTYAV